MLQLLVDSKTALMFIGGLIIMTLCLEKSMELYLLENIWC